MYKDIIDYELAENVSEEQLIRVGGQIVEDWMKKLPGFVSWEISKDKDSNYTDIVTWASEEDAKNATKEMANIPNATDWYACYKEGSIKSKNLISCALYKKEE